MTAVLAHRGAGSRGPEAENTVAAIEEARRLGADGVEIDVRRARDGELVVIHDPALRDGKLVCELPPDRLPSEVPSLAEALEWSHGLFVNVEVKNSPREPDYDPAETVARGVTALLSRDVDRYALTAVVVSSFSPAAVAAARGPFETALLARAGRPHELIDLGHRVGAGGLHPVDDLVTPGLVASARAAGLAVRVWTVDAPQRIGALGRLGADAVITNDVAAARRALLVG